MNYRPTWNLESIPFEVIPGHLLKRWRAQHNGSKGGAARIKDDPATEEKRRRQRIYSARYRANPKKKPENTEPDP